MSDDVYVAVIGICCFIIGLYVREKIYAYQNRRKENKKCLSCRNAKSAE